MVGSRVSMSLFLVLPLAAQQSTAESVALEVRNTRNRGNLVDSSQRLALWISVWRHRTRWMDGRSLKLRCTLI